MNNPTTYQTLSPDLKKAAAMIHRYFNDEATSGLSFADKCLTLEVACRVNAKAADFEHVAQLNQNALELLNCGDVKALLDSIELQNK